MLTLHEQVSQTRVTHDRTLLARQIEATDQEIDGLVYELYGLTNEDFPRFVSCFVL